MAKTVYRIEFSFGTGDRVGHGIIDLPAENVQEAIHAVEMDLASIAAHIDSVNPSDEL